MVKRLLVGFSAASLLFGSIQAVAATNPKPDVYGSDYYVAPVVFKTTLKFKGPNPVKAKATMKGIMVGYERISSDKGFLWTNYKWSNIMIASSGGASSDTDGYYNSAPYIDNASVSHAKANNIEFSDIYLRSESGFGYAQVFKHFITKESFLTGVEGEKRTLRNIVKNPTNNTIHDTTQYVAHLYLGARLELDYMPIESLKIGVIGDAAFIPKVKFLNFLGDKYFGGLYKMGSGFKWRVTVPVKFSYKRLSLGVAGFYEKTTIKKSDTENVDFDNTYNEQYVSYMPKTTITNKGFYAFLSFRF